MKKYFFLFTCLLSSTLLMAQNPLKSEESCKRYSSCEKRSSKCDKSSKFGSTDLVSKKWRVNAVGIGVGDFGDTYQNMSVEGMKSMAIDLPSQNMNLTGLRQDQNTVMISGANLGAYISLSPRNSTKDGYRTGQELRIGLNANIDREAMIQYSDFNYDNSVIYCLIENEVNISASYLFSGTLWNRLGFFGGAGMNLGSTFNNSFLLIEDRSDSNGNFESTTTTVDAKSSYYTRGFIHAGIMYHTLGRISFSLETQSGVGMQIVDGAKNNYLSDSCSGRIGLQYRFNK